MASAPHSVLNKLFVDCYDDFDASFDRTMAEAGGAAIVCFGITGAGKSTFLARLRSPKTCGEFHQAVFGERHSGEDYTTEEGVRIGHKAPSTTLVPKLHAVGNMGVWDVPGFKDNNQGKQIVINILHMCLLRRLNKAKFLIVVDVNVLFQENAMTTLVGDYHGKLRELFAHGSDAQYNQYIQHFYLVLTHNDKHHHTEQQIKEQITEKMIECAGESDGLHLFFNRMLKSHVVADYAHQDKATLVAALSNLLDTASQEGGIAAHTIDCRYMEVHGNMLNNRCAAAVDTLSEKSSKQTSSTHTCQKNSSDSTRNWGTASKN